MLRHSTSLFRPFFFNAPAPTQIYTLSLHDALPISSARPRTRSRESPSRPRTQSQRPPAGSAAGTARARRSEEHTSELQSHHDLVCRLLLEKKKKKTRQKKKKIQTKKKYIKHIINIT